jgi:hypothetical protein
MTHQVMDLLIDGEHRSYLACEPLALWPGITQWRFTMRSSANWRGYTANWEIAQGSLFLVGIHGIATSVSGGSERAVCIEDLFEKPGPVEAKWVTGTMRVVSGTTKRYVHMGYESSYEKEEDIVVEAGKILSRQPRSRRPL